MNQREHCLRIRQKVRIQKLRSRVWELSQIRRQNQTHIQKRPFPEILGCTDFKGFCFCVDCLYEKDPEGCQMYIKLWKAEVKYTVPAGKHKMKIKAARAEGVKL